jgi:signal transduction histidine kinase
VPIQPLRDQTQQVSAREISARITAAVEEEKSRLAREIHDEFGQALTGLQLSVFSLVDWTDEQWRLMALRDAGSRETTQDETRPGEGQSSVLTRELWRRTHLLARALASLHEAMRRVATALRPPILDDLGLIAALEWQVEQFTEQTGIPCSFSVTRPPGSDFDPEQATALFRIMQESLTNIARHAQAGQVDVGLWEDESGLYLQVRDNGKGIASESRASDEPQDDSVTSEDNRSARTGKRSAGLGLRGMRERAQALGGEFHIASGKGLGTTISVWLPLSLGSRG